MNYSLTNVTNKIESIIPVKTIRYQANYDGKTKETEVQWSFYDEHGASYYIYSELDQIKIEVFIGEISHEMIQYLTECEYSEDALLNALIMSKTSVNDIQSKVTGMKHFISAWDLNFGDDIF